MSTGNAAPVRSGDMTIAKRRVLAGTLAGTTIEWYDFFIYAQAAGLVFAPLFFAPVSERSPGLATVLSLATIGISFFFRPLGAMVAGRFGDRLGRKRMLVLTLLLMGGATVLIGVLPSYAEIGVLAPILLIVLRVVQGFSAGGEWGGAALMAVEHAPKQRRGLFGSFPQMGVPIGMILATGVLWLATTATTEEQFQSWGWRIPFLFSVVLIGIGYAIRRAVEESPVFQEMVDTKKESAAPLKDLFKGNSKQIVRTGLTFMGNNATGYLVISYFISYGVKTLGLKQSSVLLAIVFASTGWLIATYVSGRMSDSVGRLKPVKLGYAIIIVWIVPLFLLIDTGNIWLFAGAIFVLTIGVGFTYGPMSAMYAEMFPAAVRYSGISLGYAMGSILGGAFAPVVAELLIQKTGMSSSVGVYIMVVCGISFVTLMYMKEPAGTDLRAATVGNRAVGTPKAEASPTRLE